MWAWLHLEPPLLKFLEKTTAEEAETGKGFFATWFTTSRVETVISCLFTDQFATEKKTTGTMPTLQESLRYFQNFSVTTCYVY